MFGFLYYANRSRKQYAKQAKLRSKKVKNTSLSTKNKHKYAHDLQIVEVLSYEKESSIITKKDSKFLKKTAKTILVLCKRTMCYVRGNEIKKDFVSQSKRYWP